MNPFLSCVNLIDSCGDMSLCLTRQLSCVFGGNAKIGKEVLQKHECAEIFIHSTYKTNSSKFELFAVLRLILGFDVPISYMLLQRETQID